jgi:ADP-dependent NAD(P)H-hydrate dehydratase / NAD(P)H-hydrate epimerase
VVLKGCGSVCAFPEGDWHLNTSGNPGMATAGMGDVLAGLLGALIAQGAGARAALLAAVRVHGLAADQLAASGIGPVGLTASETIDAARAAWNRLA